MSQVDLLEAEPRVVSNPFLEIPLSPEAGGSLSPVSGNSGITNRQFQDSYQPLRVAPESSGPVIDAEWEDVKPESFESPQEFRERMRREWAESDTRLIEDLERIDRDYDRTIADIEGRYPNRSNRGNPAAIFERNVGLGGGLVEGGLAFIDARNQGQGFFESSGRVVGAIGGGAAGEALASRAVAPLSKGVAKTGVGAFVGAAALGGARVAGALVGGYIGEEVGGYLGRGIDDALDRLFPGEEYSPAEEVFGGDLPLDAPLKAPSRDPESPDYNPSVDFDGGQCEGVGYDVEFTLTSSYGGSHNIAASAPGPILGVFVDDPSPWHFAFVRWRNSEGNVSQSKWGISSRNRGTEVRVSNILITRTDGQPDDCGNLVPDPEPAPAPTKPAPYEPSDPVEFDQPATGSPFTGFPGFGGNPFGSPFDFIPRFRPSFEPTGDPASDPLTPDSPNPDTQPKPTPDTPPDGLPKPTSDPFSDPTSDPQSPTFDEPKSDPSGNPSPNPVSGPGSEPVRDPEWKPYRNPKGEPDLEPINPPTPPRQSESPQKCDPCSKLDEVLGLLRDEFSNSINLTPCDEGGANGLSSSASGSGFEGLSSSNQLILDGVTQIWNRVKCEAESVGSVPESFIAKAPTIKPQLQLQFKRSEGKSSSRWHVTIPHFNQAFKDALQPFTYERGDIRCVYTLMDNTKIIVNARDKGEGIRVISYLQQFVESRYQVPVSSTSFHEIPGRGITKQQVVSSFAKYFSGTLEAPPLWTRRLS